MKRKYKAGGPARPRGKHWCVTVNNPTEADVPGIELLTYLVLGTEVGEGGTRHYQGFCCFKNRQYLGGAKRLFPRGHLELKSKNSTFAECISYCKKDGDWKEWGVQPISNAQRMTDRWNLAYKLACEGKFEDIEKDILVRHYHAFKRIRQDHPDKPFNLAKPCGYWYLGPTGCGKSHTARTKFPDLYDKPLNKWWDGYRGESTVLLDDVGPKQAVWLGYFLKRWGDKYPFPAESKGTTHQIRPQRIIVTSQYTIAELYHDDPLLLQALERRYKVVKIKRWDPEWDAAVRNQ